jgi:hypothetical protein
MIDLSVNDPKKVKSMADCLAKDLSWCLSAKFEQECRNKTSNAHKSSIACYDSRIHLTSIDEEDVNSIMMEVIQETSQDSETEELKERFTKMRKCIQFCPSSSYLNESEDYLTNNVVEMNEANLLF